MRFSDVELMQLRRDFDQHKIEHDQRLEQLASMIQENTRITTQLARSIERQARSTEGLVKLYRDAQGVARLGTGLQRFLIWLLKWGVVGTAVSTALHWAVGKFNA